MDRYGDRLVCVRYRYDPDRRKRLKTVELIEEESEWLPSSALYLVKIGYDEVELREAAKQAGALWNRDRKLWMLRGEAVRRLNLEARIAGWIELE